MTAATPTATGLILAIDLGKYKSVARVCYPATGEVLFTTFEPPRTNCAAC
jgi:hypothetical protein